MDDLHVTVEPERIVASNLILRSWSAKEGRLLGGATRAGAWPDSSYDPEGPDDW